MIKTKSFDVKVDENGMISGYASTWTREPDSYGDIVAKGATYNGVESITFPVSGGGDATFYEVSDTTAEASDVASGKYFYTSSGVKTQGTASGGSAKETPLFI